MNSLSYAQQYDKNYLKWKEAQLAQDEKLKREGKQPTSANHYLSRPTLESNKTKQSSGQSNSTSSSIKVNINTATAEQLQQLHGVGEKKAQEILEYRRQHGRFKSIEELTNVKGFGPKMFEKNKNMIRI